MEVRIAVFSSSTVALLLETICAISFESLICNCNILLQAVEVHGCKTVPLLLALSTGSVLYVLYFQQNLLKFPLWKISFSLFARDLCLTKQASHKSKWLSPLITGYCMAGTYADCFSLMNCTLQSLKRLGFITTTYQSFSGVNNRQRSISPNSKTEKKFLLQWYAINVVSFCHCLSYFVFYMYWCYAASYGGLWLSLIIFGIIFWLQFLVMCQLYKQQ